MFKKLSHIIIALSLFSIGYLQYNLIANKHVHVINGVRIVHAHPYHKSHSNVPFQQHSHSGNELIIFSQLNHTLSFCDDFPVLKIELPVTFIINDISVATVYYINTTYDESAPFRAPPCLI